MQRQHLPRHPSTADLPAGHKGRLFPPSGSPLRDVSRHKAWVHGGRDFAYWHYIVDQHRAQRPGRRSPTPPICMCCLLSAANNIRLMLSAAALSAPTPGGTLSPNSRRQRSTPVAHDAHQLRAGSNPNSKQDAKSTPRGTQHPGCHTTGCRRS